jgi:hypothetical protein
VPQSNRTERPWRAAIRNDDHSRCGQPWLGGFRRSSRAARPRFRAGGRPALGLLVPGAKPSYLAAGDSFLSRGPERHARLAMNASQAVTEFLLATWHERKGSSGY